MISPENVLAFTNSDAKFYEDNLLAADDWAFDPSFIVDNDLSYANGFPGIETTARPTKDFIFDDSKLKSDFNLIDALDADDFFNQQRDRVIKEEPLSPYSLTSLPSSPEHELQLEHSVPEMSHVVTASAISNGVDNACIHPPASKRRVISDGLQPTTVACSSQPSSLPSIRPQPTVASSPIPRTVPQGYIIKADPQTLQSIKASVKGCNLRLPLPSKNITCSKPSAVTVKLEQGSDVMSNLLRVNVNGVIPSSNKQNMVMSPLHGAHAANPSLPEAASFPSVNSPPNADGKLDHVKVEKRQQRMIKNRESASQSRKRKKEYLQTLEERINLLTSFNTQLKYENDSLKMKVRSLETENSSLKVHPSETTDTLSVAKKTTCLLAVIFLLSLNVSSLSRSSSKDAALTHIAHSPSAHIGRHLLEVKENDLDKQGVNYRNSVLDNSAKELPVQSRFRPDLTMELERNLLKSLKSGIVNMKDNRLKQKKNLKHRQKDPLLKPEDINLVNLFEHVDCSTYFNKTDASRITEALEGLVKRQAKPKRQFKAKSSNVTDSTKAAENCTQNRKRRVYNALNSRWKDTDESSRLSKQSVQTMPQTSKQDKTGVLIYKASSFADSIKREDDTFYVMSLRPDHFILPARRYNDTQRPKVSFMLPAFNDSRGADNGIMQLMQIDCHVMDMKVISIDKNVLPQPTSL